MQGLVTKLYFPGVSAELKAGDHLLDRFFQALRGQWQNKGRNLGVEARDTDGMIIVFRLVSCLLGEVAVKGLHLEDAL